MRLHHLLKVHSIKLVAGQHQDMLDFGLLNVPQLFPNGVSSALVPGFSVIGLLCCEDLDEASSEPVEPIGLPHVSMKAH